MPKASAKHSPKTTKCLYCGKRCISKGVYEHERHHCPNNPIVKNEASEKSNVACVVSCNTQLDCVHIWPYNIQYNLQKTRHGGRARKLKCDAVWRRVLHLKSDGTRYREAPRRGQAPTRLRQARITKNNAITRRITRGHKYNAKCSAQPTSQEMFGGRQCTGAGVYCCSAS